jgi:uncharacterized damage-inducible protein DinB
MATHLRRLFAHMQWADGEVLASLRAATHPPEQALGLYAHVLAAEHNWLARLAGTNPMPLFPTLSLHACEELARENHARYDALARSLATADLERVVHYRRMDGESQERRLEDILLHVALHGQHHRGQVARLLREAGEVPASTDYIRWCGLPAS